MQGRKPKPTNLRLIQGNPGKRVMPEAAPQPTVEMIDPPDWLDDYAKEVWQGLIEELFRLGLVSKLDVPFLCGVCISAAEARHAYEDIKTNDRIYTTKGRNGDLKKTNPAVAQMHSAFGSLRALGSEFGLSPASRVRLTGVAQGELFAPGGPASRNEFDEF